jgi:hypothetical protein
MFYRYALENSIVALGGSFCIIERKINYFVVWDLSQFVYSELEVFPLVCGVFQVHIYLKVRQRL